MRHLAHCMVFLDTGSVALATALTLVISIPSKSRLESRHISAIPVTFSVNSWK
jgi:hypothetical protein